MLFTLFVMFADSSQSDPLEKCLLSQGFQHDIAVDDSVALTGPHRGSRRYQRKIFGKEESDEITVSR
jgi:hypothetical protein